MNACGLVRVKLQLFPSRTLRVLTRQVKRSCETRVRAFHATHVAPAHEHTRKRRERDMSAMTDQHIK